MVPFAGLLAALDQIPDPRRRQGQRYSLAHLLLFAVLAILALLDDDETRAWPAAPCPPRRRRRAAPRATAGHGPRCAPRGP